MAEYKSQYTGEQIDAAVAAAQSAVQFAAQTLTEDQQATARSNIGAASQTEVDTLAAAVGAIINLDVPFTVGGYYSETDGRYRAGNNYQYTDYIKCGSACIFVVENALHVCGYDENRTFIGTADKTAVTGYSYITISATKSSTPVVKLKKALSNRLDGWTFDDSSVSARKLEGGMHDPYSNLLDPSTFIQGKYIYGRNDGDGGMEIASDNFWATPLIKIDPEKSYYCKCVYARNYAFFDANFTFVANGTTVGEPALTDPFTPPSGAEWVRLSVEATHMGENGNRDAIWLAETHFMRADKRDYVPISVETLSAVQNPVHHIGKEFSTFTKCLCIGDSLTDGSVDDGTKYPVYRKYSYPAQLQKMTGVECTNMGASGSTTPGWYELYGNNDLSGHDCCIVMLSINDMFDSISDTDTETALRSIIAKVQADNPGIRIFLSTLPKSYNTQTNRTAYLAKNAVIEAVAADTDGVYLINTAVYSECWKDTPYATGHLTAIGYNKLAAEFAAYIGHIILHNPGDFQNIQFIGTN